LAAHHGKVLFDWAGVTSGQPAMRRMILDGPGWILAEQGWTNTGLQFGGCRGAVVC